jgi:hypothetical protein
MVIYLSPTKNTTYVFGKTPLYALGAVLMKCTFRNDWRFR